MIKKTTPKKITIILILAIMYFTNCYLNDDTTNSTEENTVEFNGTTYSLGLIPVSEETYRAFPKLIVQQRATLPSSIDMSPKMPKVGNQGSQGSCVGWATAYAYKTYQEGVDREWNVQNNKAYQFSPAYVYNQINGGEDRGAYIHDALQLIVAQGSATLQSMPYNDRDYRTQPNSSQKNNAKQYKGKRWWSLSNGDVTAIKNHLADGYPIVVGIPVYPDFNISSKNPIYDNTNGSLSGYHAITFVGYDDSKNAFKFINSWGTSWGFNGYGWMSYQLIKQLRVKAYVMEDIDNGSNDGNNDGNDDGIDDGNDDNSNDDDDVINNDATIKMLKSTFKKKEKIVIKFSNLPGNHKDWIGIYRNGKSDQSYLKWKYTNGAKDGFMIFRGFRKAGSYEARLFFDDSYTLKEKVSFTITTK